MKNDTKRTRTYPHAHVMVTGAVILVAVPFALLAFPGLVKIEYDAQQKVVDVVKEVLPPDTRPVLTHVPTPESVRAIYMTACVAGTPSFRKDLIELVEETELNALVIDIKDFSGSISFPTEDPSLQGAWQSANCGARDMKEFIATLHDKGIYIIGRITVFQDPYYTSVRPDLAVKRESDGGVWQDYKKLSFIDVGAEEYWEYIIELSKESYNLGFDELNFDYIRFPSDGNMKDIAFTHTTTSKAEQLEIFFAHLHDTLSDPELYSKVRHKGTEIPVLSADLFGMTTTNTDDLNIGQVLERALPYFDYIAPMVYPSHYPPGFNGWANPNNHPYELIHFVMTSGVERARATTTPVLTLEGELISTTTTPHLYSKRVYDPLVLRPWLQDFDYGGDYDVEEVKAQIQATYDAGLNSWMLWAPSNRYTRGALLPSENGILETVE